MIEFLTVVIQLLVGGGAPVWVYVVFAIAGAVVIVGGAKIAWPKVPVSPDLVENPPSPAIEAREDGSIPVSNPANPPDPGPM